MEGQGLELKKGAWSAQEDLLLTRYVDEHGEGKWHLTPKRAGLNRCGKSCRMRWLNYLTPRVKKGKFAEDEIDLMVRLHKLLGNRWSLIAGRIPGRTANNVKNFLKTNFKKFQTPTCFNEKVVILPKFNASSKVEVIIPQVLNLSKSLGSLKNKSVMIETQTNVIDDTMEKTKENLFENLSTGTLLEHEQGNQLSSIWSIKSPCNEAEESILNDDISQQQRDDYWQQYLSNSIYFNNWDTSFKLDKVGLELETLPQVNNGNICLEQEILPQAQVNYVDVGLELVTLPEPRVNNDNAVLEPETLPRVNNDWDGLWENMDIWKSLIDE